MMFHFTPELAYIGPGAGFAFLGSFLTLLGGVLLGLAQPAAVALPHGGARGPRAAGLQARQDSETDFPGAGRSRSRRSPSATWPKASCPNLSRLREQGDFHRLRTTFPALSPVAWSTFATGVNPARHSMFDFLNRSLSSYMPELSSSRVQQSGAHPEARQVPHPAEPADRGDAPQEQDLLADPGRAADRLHHPARAHHVSAREVQRPHALRHVYAGPARHAGHVRAVHHRAADSGEMESGNRYPAGAARTANITAKSKARRITWRRAAGR